MFQLYLISTLEEVNLMALFPDRAKIDVLQKQQENIEIAPGISKLYSISQIYFSKPILCKQNQDYSIILYSKTLTNSYYGQQGKNIIEGEIGINFTFKRIQGRSSGSGIETGNFPELYYYIH